MTQTDDLLYAPIDEFFDKIGTETSEVILSQARSGLHGVMEPFLFEMNNAATRRKVLSVVAEFLRPMVENYMVVCDSRNNTDIGNRLVVDIWVQPTIVDSLVHIPVEIS